jgi:hypothetical protein
MTTDEDEPEEVHTRPCPWCGVQVPEDRDCPQPSDYCDHS